MLFGSKITKKILQSAIVSTFLLFVFVTTSQAATFTRAPFLQNVKTDSVEIRWVTDTNEPLIVKYGTSTSYGLQASSNSVSGTGGNNNHAIIQGLQTNTKYYYQVLTSGGTAMTRSGDSEYYFKTAPLTGSTTPFTFAVWGDSGNNSTLQKNVAKQVALKHPSLTLIAGDIAYGYTTDFTNNNSLYFNQYTDTANGQNSMRYSPFYVTCGNHELSCPSVMADHSLPGGGNMAGISTFSFDYGNVHFVSLNSNGSYSYNSSSPSLSDPQMRWAYYDLIGSQQPWKVIFWHHNGWSAGSHSSNTAITDNMLKLASDTGADVVTWGHSHVYERWNRKSGYYPNLQAFTIGNGGQSGASSCTDTSPGPGCAFKSTGSSESGFLYAEVNGDLMTIHYIKSDGSNPDTITLNSTGTLVNANSSPTGVQVTQTPRPTIQPTLTVINNSPTVAPTRNLSPTFALSPTSIVTPQVTQGSTCPMIATSSSRATISLNIPTTGTYKIWSRLMSLSDNSNSYYLQVDDNCPINVGDLNGSVTNSWQWISYQSGLITNPIVQILTTGPHTVNLISREIGVKLDKLIFTQDLNCVPVDFGTNCLTLPSLTPTFMPTVTPIVTPISTLNYETPTPSPATVLKNLNIRNLDEIKVNSNSATIKWQTTEAASTYVLYGTSNSDLNMSTPEDTNLSKNHSSTIVNLTTNTRYYYQVHSKNSLGIDYISPIQEFITK